MFELPLLPFAAGAAAAGDGPTPGLLALMLAGVVGLGMLAQWVAWRTRLPSVLLLLAAGVLAGPVASLTTGTALIDPDQFGKLLVPLVQLFVAIILFEGGMSLKISELRETTSDVRNMVTIGALVVWLTASAGAILLLELPVGVAILLGAILVVSGPTVVVPLLRQIRPARRVGSVVKWEGIVNDPIGAVLAVLVLEVLLVSGGHPESASVGTLAVGIARSLVTALAVGVGIGWFFAWLLVLLIRKHWLPDYLHSPTAVALVVVGFAASNVIQAESGLITVTLMGILVTNQKKASMAHILEFKEVMRTLLISVLFIVLSARLPVDRIGTVLTWQGLAFVLVLLFVSRPLAVWLSTRRSGLTVKERVFVGWMAPRGIVAAAVASIFAQELVHAHVLTAAQADHFVLTVFLVVIATVAVYGLTAAPLARRLKLSVANPQGVIIVGADSWQVAIGKALQEAGFPVLIVDTNWRNVSEARMAGLSTFYGSVLSEYALDRMDLEGKGRLLAMTRNDELNALAVQHLLEVFSRRDCYQLAMGAEGAERSEKVGMHQRGRLLFDHTATYDDLGQRMARGATIKVTTLSDSFDLQAFREEWAERAVPLFLITDNDELLMWTADSPPTARSGHRLVALVEETDETRMVKARERHGRRSGSGMKPVQVPDEEQVADDSGDAEEGGEDGPPEPGDGITERD